MQHAASNSDTGRPGDRPHGPTAKVPANAEFQAESDKIVGRQHMPGADAPAVLGCRPASLLPCCIVWSGRPAGLLQVLRPLRMRYGELGHCGVLYQRHEPVRTRYEHARLLDRRDID